MAHARGPDLHESVERPNPGGEPAAMPVVAPPVLFDEEIEALELWQRALAAADSRLRCSPDTSIEIKKLEAIGKLAAGVAHEISTPIQYVADNVAYVARAFVAIREALRSVEGSRGGGAELDAFLDEVPRALSESLDGLERLASISAALRDFSHPSRGLREPFDLNQGLLATITVARSEWRYVADVATELDPTLPPVVGIRDELSQAFLNLIVNAAHAIGDAQARGRTGRGLITVASGHTSDEVMVHITDTGDGIPDEIRHRIFEPVYTTKPVGRGTGQGLALVHAVVVDRHGGTIQVASRREHGTTFTIKLPLGSPRPTP